MKECSSAKRGYHTHAGAMRDAHNQMRNNRHLILRVYRCPECHEWHMTSMPKLKKEVPKKRGIYAPV